MFQGFTPGLLYKTWPAFHFVPCNPSAERQRYLELWNSLRSQHTIFGKLITFFFEQWKMQTQVPEEQNLNILGGRTSTFRFIHLHLQHHMCTYNQTPINTLIAQLFWHKLDIIKQLLSLFLSLLAIYFVPSRFEQRFWLQGA